MEGPEALHVHGRRFLRKPVGQIVVERGLHGPRLAKLCGDLAIALAASLDAQVDRLGGFDQLLMRWTAPTAGIAMCQITVATQEPLMSGNG
jgi:hypothetical protein